MDQNPSQELNAPPAQGSVHHEESSKKSEHHLTSVQLILFTVLFSFVVSTVTSITTVYFVSDLFQSGFIKNIVSKRVLPIKEEKTREVNEKVLRQDELVVSVVKSATPAVVSIVASKDVPVVEQFFSNPFPDDPFFNEFFQQFQVPQQKENGVEKRQVSAGTGFLVSADGIIVTNKHVVADEDAEYTVFFNDSSKISARVLARDPFQDIAILKVEKTGLSSLAFGDSSKVDIGQTVIAIGNALGEFTNSVSIGIISGLGRSILAEEGGAGAEELHELIQTDAAINPGNSGGPLLNLRGEVIGINTAMARGAENIGFAIQGNKMRRDLESIRTHGKISYPFIGVRYTMVTKAVQEEKKLGVDYGALIISGQQESAVVVGSPAQIAGLKEGDIILSVNGEKIKQGNSLATILQKYSAGQTIILKVFRGSGEMTVSLTLVERK